MEGTHDLQTFENYNVLIIMDEISENKLKSIIKACLIVAPYRELYIEVESWRKCINILENEGFISGENYLHINKNGYIGLKAPRYPFY